MTPDLRAAWDRFLAGHWTRERPTQEGSYPAATVDGEPAGFRSIVFRGEQVYDNGHRGWFWAAWWWSEPMPGLPPAPKETP